MSEMVMSENIIKKLGDGLILRRSKKEDTEELMEFNGRVHAESGSDEPFKPIADWVRDLMSKPHPTFDPADFTIVEDTNTGKIVSCLNLINQTWSYEGVEFGVGRPELVGTDPEYRHRGLVRAQMNLVHDWSAQRGHLVQSITGIEYYYRLFGYEMALDLDGGRIGYLPDEPKLKDDQQEPFIIRTANAEDIPFIMNVYKRVMARNMVSCLRDADYWQYELTGKSAQSMQRSELRIIERAGGEQVGFFQHAPAIWRPFIHLYSYELKEGVSWLEVTPSVIRYLVKTGKEYAVGRDDLELAGYFFGLGADHPSYQVMSARLPHIDKTYAWYIRVADIAGFLLHIGSVLERRLAESPLVGHNGDLKLSFYRSAIKLGFENGRLVGVENYRPKHNDDGDVFFPDLTFLRVLFGYESLADLDDIFPDCHTVNDHGRALMPVLFPKRHSHVWPIA